jgi:hypothetical protein
VGALWDVRNHNGLWNEAGGELYRAREERIYTVPERTLLCAVVIPTRG